MTPGEGLSVIELRERAAKAGLAVQVEVLTPKLTGPPGLPLRVRFYPLGQGFVLADYSDLGSAWAYLSGYEAAKGRESEGGA